MGTEVANMTVWKVLLSVFFGGSGLFTFITQGLYFVGLWKIFESPGIANISSVNAREKSLKAERSR